MSAEKLRELKTLASVCPELNMANYGEDDVRHLNDWAIEMSLLVERYTLSKQPATGEPVGEVFYAADGGDDETGAGYYMKPCVHWFGKAPAADTKLYTAPQPAQATQTEVTDEREAFEAEMRCEETWGHRSLKRRPDGRYQNWQVDLMWEAWQARASLPAPQQPATPEPVVDVRCEGCGYMTHHREHMGCVRAAKQHTRPVPSVPDGYVLVPIEPTQAMMNVQTWDFSSFYSPREIWAAMLAAKDTK